jgi:hypothetical protein
VKPVSATFALIALAAATAGFAQTAPQTQPRPDPATRPSEPSTGKADAQALMKDCMTRAQAANPSATQKDVKEYCIKQVTQQSNSQPSPHE